MTATGSLTDVLFNPVSGDQAKKSDPDPCNFNGCPLTMAVSLPAFAIISGLTFTITLATPGFGQPSVSNPSKVYVLVCNGNAEGAKVFPLISDNCGSQRNDEPFV